MQNASKQLMSPEQMQELFDTCYQKAVDGVPGASKPIDELASDYLSKHETVEEAAKDFIGMQLLGALHPSYFCSSRLFDASLQPCGNPRKHRQRDLCSDPHGCRSREKWVDTIFATTRSKRLSYARLAGNAANEILKDAGIKIGVKSLPKRDQKIPFEVIKKINAAVSFRLVTKFGREALST